MPIVREGEGIELGFDPWIWQLMYAYNAAGKIPNKLQGYSIFHRHNWDFDTATRKRDTLVLLTYIESRQNYYCPLCLSVFPPAMEFMVKSELLKYDDSFGLNPRGSFGEPFSRFGDYDFIHTFPTWVENDDLFDTAVIVMAQPRII